jgi:hypothetical protein
MIDHIPAKHGAYTDASPMEVDIEPAVRPGYGEGEDPSLEKDVNFAPEKIQPKDGKWTIPEAEEWGRRVHQEIIEQWKRGVQERQISRTEAKFIRKEGSFPFFIKENILPLWDAWKGVSFEAIQGLYEQSIELQGTKVKQLRNNDKELFGPKKLLEGKELENRRKASREARKTHRILKGTGLIQDVLIWRTSDPIAEEVERGMNKGQMYGLPNHEKVREKKKKSLMKYMNALRPLIAPYDPNAAEDEDEMDEEDERTIAPRGCHLSPRVNSWREYAQER